MLNKKNLFPLVLLTTFGMIAARVVEKAVNDEISPVLEGSRSSVLREKDLFNKPFLEDLYQAEITGKLSNTNDKNKNVTLLNKEVKSPFGNSVDEYFSSRVKFDVVGNIVYNHGAEVQIGLRAKSVLGNPRAYTTTKEAIKLNEAVIGEHSHMLEPRVFFVREAWFNIELDKVLNTYLTLNNLKVGMFSFNIGRGISLGDAYAVSPVSLGFYSDTSIDQFAPGALLNGTIYRHDLEYDLYTALLTNTATNLKETGSQIYDQLLINKAYPTQFSRGFGRINFVFASRLKWTPVDDKKAGDKVYFEPYIVYNSAPEQKVEFTGDARSSLVTMGLAGELAASGYEIGFEGAFNRGHQDVYAWDRNYVTITTHTDGTVKQVYTKVYDDAAFATKTAYTGDTSIYRPATNVDSNLNGAAIGATGKFNASNRFRDAYRNNYKGWMFVIDGSTFLYKEDLKIAVTGGITSGDVNPHTNKTGTERDYKGFVPLQEMYFGERVKSYFVMGPTSSLARPHAITNDNDFVPTTEGFSNLRFIGAGITYKPQESTRRYSINPNIFMFWQDKASPKFGATTEDASNNLGVEMNIFTTVDLIDNIKLIVAGAIFKPLQHYTDIKGTQLVSQKAELSKLAAAGITENLPTLSNNTAYSLSCGIECSF